MNIHIPTTAYSEELRAAYARIDELELALTTARTQLVTLGGNEQTEDQIQRSILAVINEVLS